MKARHGREDVTISARRKCWPRLGGILDVLTMAVGALGGISLLVGGVGIITIMTIAVTERTNEIGLLVALGARRQTILGLFPRRSRGTRCDRRTGRPAARHGSGTDDQLLRSRPAGAYAPVIRAAGRSAGGRHRLAAGVLAGKARGTAGSGGKRLRTE